MRSTLWEFKACGMYFQCPSCTFVILLDGLALTQMHAQARKHFKENHS